MSNVAHQTLHNSALTWLELLPKQLATLRRTVENIKDPLYRYYEREVSSGEKKQINFLRTMLSDFCPPAGDDPLFQWAPRSSIGLRT